MASAHEDIANARIRFTSGAVATITASRVSARTERRMRLFAKDGYMAVDFANRSATVVARDRGKPVPGVEGFGIEEIAWQDQDSLAAEHAAFTASVLDGAPVLVDAAGVLVAGHGRVLGAKRLGMTAVPARALPIPPMPLVLVMLGNCCDVVRKLQVR